MFAQTVHKKNVHYPNVFHSLWEKKVSPSKLARNWRIPPHSKWIAFQCYPRLSPFPAVSTALEVSAFSSDSKLRGTVFLCFECRARKIKGQRGREFTNRWSSGFTHARDRDGNGASEYWTRLGLFSEVWFNYGSLLVKNQRSSGEMRACGTWLGQFWVNRG